MIKMVASTNKKTITIKHPSKREKYYIINCTK